VNLYAKFQTHFRGEMLNVEMSAKFDGPGLPTRIEVEFKNLDGTNKRVQNLTREELTQLCREAAKSKRN
jgi:isoleucyl-tRNA synthetase